MPLALEIRPHFFRRHTFVYSVSSGIELLLLFLRGRTFPTDKQKTLSIGESEGEHEKKKRKNVINGARCCLEGGISIFNGPAVSVKNLFADSSSERANNVKVDLARDRNAGPPGLSLKVVAPMPPVI